MFKNIKNKATMVVAGTVAMVASASSFAEVDANVTAGLTTLKSTATELSQAGLDAIIALGIVSMGIAVVIGIFRWAKRAAVN